MEQYNRGILAREIVCDYFMGKITDVDRRADIEIALRTLHRRGISAHKIKLCLLWASGYIVDANLDHEWALLAEIMGCQDVVFIQLHAETKTKELIAISRLLALDSSRL
jgi:hypothetical protein